MKARIQHISFACLFGLFTATLSVRAGESWSVTRFEREFCGEDCWEPFNRTMFGIFDVGMTYVVDPFCYVYSSVIPKPLIKGIDNFGENLEAPESIVSDALMGEWQTAWDGVRRFTINSTLGIGGLFDPAHNWFFIFDSDASLSDTLAYWGIPAGPPLALPFMPRASLRGHVGYVLDYALDLKTWFDFLVPSGCLIGWSWCLTPNKAPVWRGNWESLFAHTDDDYVLWMPLAAALSDFNMRQYNWHYMENSYAIAYARYHMKQTDLDTAERAKHEQTIEQLQHDVRPPEHPSCTRPEGLFGRWREIPGYAPRSPSLDSLRALCFAPLGDDDFWWERRSVFNRDFSKSIEDRAITIRSDLPDAHYSYVAQSTTGTTTRLVVVLPGIGAGRTATEAVAMAEFLHQQGYGVIISDSLFHWEYMRSVNRGILPGYISEDVRRYGDFIGRIRDDLVKSGKLAADAEINITGWSMGALTTAHFAAFDDAHALPLNIRRFIAINPPSSMEHALTPFDEQLERSSHWTKDEVRVMFTQVTPSLYGWAAQEHPRYDPLHPPLDIIGDPWDYAPNLSDEQANFLLGQTLRVMFPTLIAQRHRHAPFPWIKSELGWFHRRDFYKEIGDVSMREYITRYVPACYEGVDAATMIATADLRLLATPLRHNTKFTVIHTWNDPLETDDDRRSLDRLLRDRITWFADGGHCGYFYTKPFQDELLRRLSE